MTLSSMSFGNPFFEDTFFEQEVFENEKQDEDISEIKKEQKVLTNGVLACLKGLHEKGCNGPVTKAIKEIEDHLNDQAHK